MIKKGNFQNALREFKENKNNAVSYVYEQSNGGDGKLSGVVCSIKDIFATKDAPTQASSRILDGFKPGYDAEVIKKLRENGVSFVGKTHMDELGLAGTGTYSGYGVITNPLDKKRLVGGSSSGSAATFTDNISFSLGSDTGDSIRLPSSYCGIVGYKPSYGAVSRYGLFSYAPSLDTVGWFAHNVSDVISVAQLLFGKDEKDMTSRSIEVPSQEIKKPKRVAVLKNVIPKLKPAILKSFNDFRERLLSDGVVVEEVEIDQKLLDSISIVYSIISFSEAASTDSNLTGISFGIRGEGKTWDQATMDSRSKNFGFMVQRRFTIGTYFLSEKNQEEFLIRATKVRRLIVDAFNEIHKNFDVLIFPSAEPAPLIDEGKDHSFYSSLLTAANFSGNPSITLKFTNDYGDTNMPVGLTVEKNINEDKDLLSYSKYFEEIIGGEDE